MSFLVALLLLLQPTRAVDLQPAATALRENRFSEALQLTAGLLPQHSNDPRLWTLQGLAHSGLKQDAEALTDFRKAVSIAPDYLPALKAEAQIEYKIHDRRCPQTLSRIVALEPADPVSHAMLAALAYQRQDCRAVVANYAASEALIGSQAPALTEYGQCLFDRGMKEKASEIFAKVVALDPAWHGRYNLAVANLAQGRAQDALAVVAPLRASANPQLLDIAASAYEQLGDTPQAVETLRQAIIAGPDRADLYLHFADLSFAHNSFQVGVDMLDLGLRKLPDSPRLYLARGILLVQLGKFAKADGDFAKAAELDPSQAFSSVAQGLTQVQQSNLDGALAITRARLKQNPHDADLHYLEAETLRQKGIQTGTAEFDQALAAVQSAVRLRPKFPLAQDLLGTLYLRQGKLGLATRQFESVVASDPNNEPALYHLITASRKLGDNQAVESLMKRLTQAKTANKEQEARANRYRFFESAQN